MSSTLTFDLGTTYFKGALFDGHGALRALARRRVEATHPSPGRWELSVEAFHGALCGLAGELKEAIGTLQDVEAIGFATQTNSFVLLDGHDRPITPLILWPDERARDSYPSVDTILEGVVDYAQTGVPAVGPQFMLAKLLWLGKHQQDLWRQARRLALIGDFLALWLTGEHVTEAGAAGLTAMVDIRRLCWSAAVLERLGVPVEWLPSVARAGTDLGTIRREAAAALGVPEACRVVLGCLDQYAGAIGAGNVTPGGLSETTGTVLATVQCVDRLAQEPDGDVFQGPAFEDGLFFRMVFGEVSANLLERYRDSLPERPSFDELTRAASEVPAGAEGLRLSAEPHRASLEEMFAGRRSQHQRGHEVRAILEAIAEALAGQVGRLTGKAAPEGIRSVGGAARSDVWRQIKANTLGCPVVATTCPEPTSLGAAILATATLRGEPVPGLADQWVETLPPDLPEKGFSQR